MLKYMMGMTAPGQEVRITQKHFTPTCDKGHPLYQQVLTPDLSYHPTTLGEEEDILPPQLSVPTPVHPSRLRAIFRNLPEMFPLPSEQSESIWFAPL